MSDQAYKLRPIQLGAEVIDYDLSSNNIPKTVIEKIKKDVAKHKIVVFRNQENLSPQKHLEIGRWFGNIKSTFYNHPKSPSLDIFRVSNDDTEGCTNVGRTGWHIDGSFMPAPFSHSLYHIISAPTMSSTSFISLTDVIKGLSEERREFWNRLWMVSDSHNDLVHPLIYTHPITGLPTLCFHLGMTEGFILDYGTNCERQLSMSDTYTILRQIRNEFLKNPANIYHHKYQPGDFIISDNLAVGHEASPDTQWPRDKIGLRVMHRVTVAGTTKPGKSYKLANNDFSELKTVASLPSITDKFANSICNIAEDFEDFEDMRCIG